MKKTLFLLLVAFACTKEMRSDMPRENKWGKSTNDEAPDPAVKSIEEISFPAAPAEAIEEGPKPNPQFHLRVANVSNQPIEFILRRAVSPDIAGWYIEKKAEVVAEGPDFKTFVVPGLAFKLQPRSSILIRVFNGPVSVEWIIKLDKDPKKWLKGVVSASVPADTGVDIPNGLKDQFGEQ